MAIARQCNDPILKSEVLTHVQAAANFTTQLKIICGVKAASDEDDPTTENIIITCAQGLSDAVVKCLSASESAQVRIDRDNK